MTNKNKAPESAAFLKWWNEHHCWDFVAEHGQYEKHAQKCFIAGYTANLSDALKQKDKRIEELRLERDKWFGQALDNKHRIAELEAKLAKALAGLERIAHVSDVYGVEANAKDQGADTLAYAHKSTCNLARTTIAEIQGNLNGDTNE